MNELTSNCETTA